MSYEDRYGLPDKSTGTSGRYAQRNTQIADFLKGRAGLRRVTTMQEVARAVNLPRHKVAKALGYIAKDSFEADGVLLPAVVVHFHNNRPGHRFYEWAMKAGLLDNEGADRDEVHRTELEKVFAKYAPGTKFVAIGARASAQDRWKARA